MNKSLPVFVGIDYADQVSQVVVLDATGRQVGSRRIASDAATIVAYAERRGPIGGVAIEACCGAARLADELIGRYGWPTQLAHPGYVRRMKQNPDKTDYSDARILADLRRVGYLPPVWLAPSAIRELRRVTRGRQALVEEARRVKLRVRALLRDHRLAKPESVRRVWTHRGLAWLNELTSDARLPSESQWLLQRHLDHLGYLAEELVAYERRLECIADADPLIGRLLEHPGIGLVTACVLRAEIGQFERFHSGKQLAHYCGVTPQNASSGQRQADAGLVRGGNRQLKLALIELAHRLKRYDDRWRDFATRLTLAGKARCVIVAAVANRWVRQLYYQMRPPVPEAA
jgi:transposase